MFCVRTPKDIENILNYDAKKIVIIGGGLLGIETSEILLQEKKNKIERITMIESSERILPKQLDVIASSIYQKILEENGLKVLTGDLVKDFSIQDELVDKVLLKSGKEIDANLVICTLGTKTNISLAQKLGLKIGRNIVVDSEMKTSLDNIYAAGDCAEFEGFTIPNWSSAVEEGEIAGYNSVGLNIKYKRNPSPYTLKSFKTNVFSCGNLNTPKFLVKGEDKNYLKLHFDNAKKCVGALNIGKFADTSSLMKCLINKISFDDAIKKFFI